MRTFLFLIPVLCCLNLFASTKEPAVKNEQSTVRETVKLTPPSTVEKPREPVLIPDLGDHK